MNPTHQSPKPTPNFAIPFVAFMTALFVALPAQAQDPKPIDLGVLQDGDVVWLDEKTGDVTVQRAKDAPVNATPDVPCEVCVSRAIVLQAEQDAQEADRLRKDLGSALFRVEFLEDTNKAQAALNSKLRRDLEKEKARPGFWAGAGFGAGATVVTLLIVVLVAR